MRSSGLLQAVQEQMEMRSSPVARVPAWTQEQWWEAFNTLFLPQSGEAHGGAPSIQQNDDLLFFVHAISDGSRVPRKTSGGGPASPGLDTSGMPYTVRRRGRQLAAEWQKTGANFQAVAWDETLLLNLVLQAHYILTAVVCREQLLSQVAQGITVAEGVNLVTKRVYASPIRSSVNLEKPNARSGTSSARPCYPNVCFAVENFDDAFSDMVMADPDHCYCVIMHAVPQSLAAARADASTGGGQAPDGSTAPEGGPRPAETSRSRTVLFSGYVSHEQVSNHLEQRAQQQLLQRRASFLGGLLTRQQSGTRERIILSGPDGMGEADVAVQSLHAAGSGSKGLGAASRDADQASAQQGPGVLSAILGAVASILLDDEEEEAAPAAAAPLPRAKLQCALMSMQLPVEKLARSILDAFIGWSPPVAKVKDGRKERRAQG